MYFSFYDTYKKKDKWITSEPPVTVCYLGTVGQSSQGLMCEQTFLQIDCLCKAPPALRSRKWIVQFHKWHKLEPMKAQKKMGKKSANGHSSACQLSEKA